MLDYLHLGAAANPPETRRGERRRADVENMITEKRLAVLNGWVQRLIEQRTPKLNIVRTKVVGERCQKLCAAEMTGCCRPS